MYRLKAADCECWFLFFIFDFLFSKNNSQHNGCVSLWNYNTKGRSLYSFFIFIFRAKNDNRSLLLCQFAYAELPFFFFAFVEEHGYVLCIQFWRFSKHYWYQIYKKWVNIFILTCFCHSFLKLLTFSTITNIDILVYKKYMYICL